MTSALEAARSENDKHRGSFPGATGVEFLEVSPERVTARLQVTPGHLQPYGFVHGGVFTTIADTCASVAAVQGLPPDRTAMTVQLSCNYLSSLREGELRAESVAVHRGSRSMVYETRVTNTKGRLMALVTTSHMVVNFG